MTSRFTGAMLHQLSYDATDFRSRSIVGSYVSVKEMSVNVGVQRKECVNYWHIGHRAHSLSSVCLSQIKEMI